MPARESTALRAQEALVQALRQHVHPLPETPHDHDPLLALIGDARFALLGEASHGTHEFYRERGDHPAPDPRKRLHRRGGRGRLAGCLSRQPLRARPGDDADANDGARRLQALPRLDVAQHRCARLRRMAARPQRRARRRRAGRLLRPRPVQPVRLHRTPCCDYLEQGGSRGGPQGAGALRLLRPLRRGHPGLRLRRQLRPDASRARTRWCSSCASCNAAPPTCSPARRSGSATRRSSPSRTRAWCKNAEEYYRTMFRGARLVMEPARPPHGRDARGAGSRT